jgi:hypothetical protein
MTATLQECRAANSLKETIYLIHSAGCCWHIVLDDQNVKDKDVDWVINVAIPARHIDTSNACRKIAPLMRSMSVAQRKKLARGGYR